MRPIEKGNEQTPPSLFELALANTKVGISVIPVSLNKATVPGDSQDTPFDCREFIQRRVATPEELRVWFGGAHQFGLAAVHGAISGGLECLDLLYTAVAKLFRELVTLEGGDRLLERLPTARDVIHGRTRLYYRCPNHVSGERRLAQFELPSKPHVTALQLLAFVRGEGSWTTLPGSSEHSHGSTAIYEWLGRDLTEVPIVTEDERRLLLESASCLNAWVDPAAILAPAAPNGFDDRVAWEQILVPLRWTKVKDFGELAVWHTPERTKPGYCAISGLGFNRDLLYMIRPGRAYTKFGAFARFFFDGNLEKARSVRLRPASPSRQQVEASTRQLVALKATSPPRISCLMPTTGDRRRFLPQAIKYFQRQTYPNLELLILCDGDDDVSDLIPRDDGRIHYSYLGLGRRTLGAKLNLGCERASGDLIAHFDDDDWSHPDRLTFQVGALMTQRAEICGISQLLFLEVSTGRIWLNRSPALAHPSLYPGLPFGATYLYRRSYWSSSPFPDLSLDSDTTFTSSEGRQDRCALVREHRLYVAMIHSSNTCDSKEKSSYWSPWTGDIREVMGADFDFYRCLQQAPKDDLSFA